MRNFKHQNKLDYILNKILDYGHGTKDQLEKSNIREMFEGFDISYYESIKYIGNKFINHQVDELCKTYKRNGVEKTIKIIEIWLNRYNEMKISIKG
jgi:hypothetical protein